VSATESNPLVEAHVDLEVQFHDADPMGVTWHGNYFRYLESGEVVTRALTTQVAVGKDDGETLFCSPQILLDKVRACRDST